MSESIFSTDVTGGNAWDPSKTLTDYVVTLSYEDHPLWDENDDEQQLVVNTIRPIEYQDRALKYIAQSVGYYRTGVYRMAWMRGMDVLDDRMDTGIWRRARDASNHVMYIVGNYGHDSVSGSELDRVLSMEEVDDLAGARDDSSELGEFADRRSFRVIPEQKARISTNFNGVMNFGAWTNRVLIDLGITGSERVPNELLERAEKMADAFIDAVHESSKRVLNSLNNYLLSSSIYWMENGIHEDVLADMMIIADMADDKRSKALKSQLYNIKEGKEYKLLSHSDHDYTPLLEVDYIDIDTDAPEYYHWRQ